MSLCNIFINSPPGAYRPLACKPITAITRSLRGTGRENKADLFTLTKGNTIRERATLDLILLVPDWLVNRGGG